MNEDKLMEIASECVRGYEADEESRSAWLEETQRWMDLAKQVREEKTWPWPGASNIKYPLISTAALQFSARAYPTLVPSDGKIVKTQIIGPDPSGEKAKQGERVSTYMSWQLTNQMDYWEEDMDRLLIMLAVTGVVFKKTYYDPITDKVESRTVYPENFCVNYWSTSLEEAPRYSEILYLYEQEVKARQLAKVFLDVDLGTPPIESDQNKPGKQNDLSWTTPFKVIQQYTWLDLDDDGLREPYIVTFHYNSRKILRIEARFGPDEVLYDNENDTVVGYKPYCYFTKYSFIPNPDGSFYDLGFGHLLGPINESSNTIVNQLTDAGTLSNLQAGFIAKGLRLKMGSSSFQPGEWKAVNATGDDLRKQIVPLPTQQPSDVLFKLLELMITSGKELASVAEIFVGKMPGQNTPATTTMASIEQGMKVFTAIYKRVYRSLAKEFNKIFILNGHYLDKNTYINVMDEAVNPDDFNNSLINIQPTADPNATSQQEKLMKAQALLELMGTGIIDPVKTVMRVLEAQQQPNWQELIPGMQETGQPQLPPKPEDPKLLAIKAKAETDKEMAMVKAREAEHKMQMEGQSKQQEMALEQQQHQQKMAHEREMGALKAQGQSQMNQIFAAESQQKAIQGAMDHSQSMSQADESHKQKMQMSKEAQSSKSQEKKSSSGKPTSSRKK
jgi:chaperonin GroES